MFITPKTNSSKILCLRSRAGECLAKWLTDHGLPDRPVRDILLAISGNRKIKSRYPFDIYEDQVETLQQLSLDDRMRGGAGSRAQWAGK